MERLLLGIEEAAQLIGLSKYTVRAYVQKGLIKPTRIGSRVLVPLAEIKRISVEGLRPGLKNNHLTKGGC
jgi:excisionase family DNA binding protein